MAAGFCPKKLALARKIMALPESRGLQPPAPVPPGSSAYDWSQRKVCSLHDCKSTSNLSLSEKLNAESCYSLQAEIMWHHVG